MDAAEQHRHQEPATGAQQGPADLQQRGTARARDHAAAGAGRRVCVEQPARARVPRHQRERHARGRSRLRAAGWRGQAGPDDPARDRRAAPADRLRERREPDAGADDRPRAGDGDPCRARRGPRPARPAADDREPGPRGGRRPARPAVHDVGHRPAARGSRGACAARRRHPDRRDRPDVLDVRHPAHGRALRPRARDTDRNGAVGIAQGERTGHDRQRARSPHAERHCRRRNRARGGGARGRRAAGAQLPHADVAGRRLRSGEPRVVQRPVHVAARRRHPRADGGAADGSAGRAARRRSRRGGDRFPDGDPSARHPLRRRRAHADGRGGRRVLPRRDARLLQRPAHAGRAWTGVRSARYRRRPAGRRS